MIFSATKKKDRKKFGGLGKKIYICRIKVYYEP